MTTPTPRTQRTKAPKAAAQPVEAEHACIGRVLSGVVTSTKMRDTVVVAVTRFVRHPKYRKFMRVTKKYHAHDPGNTAAEGQTVQIIECRPISKTKSFRLVQA